MLELIKNIVFFSVLVSRITVVVGHNYRRRNESTLQLLAWCLVSAPFHFPAENLIVNYGEVNRRSDYQTVKQESHPPPKNPLPMNPLATPVTEWGAPGAYTLLE